MEVLVRWSCPYQPPHDNCPYCKGPGYLEQWMPAESLRYLSGYHFIIRARRRLSGKAGVA
jgi:hypothetical protein